MKILSFKEFKNKGNMEVELITSHNKRKDYEKGSSPHSWTIVDNEELLIWFLGNM